jgi:hypothetical protein
VRGLVCLTSAFVVALSGVAHAEPPTGPSGGCGAGAGWRVVSTDTFRLPMGLTRSQGVTTDGSSWIFSWQGGLERTDDAFLTQAYGTLPPDVAAEPQVNPDGTNHVGGNHIGDIDYDNGLVYAPVEDGGENLQATQLNNPEYQRPYIAVYDARTLRYTGVKYPLPLDRHAAGVPWVSINARAHEVYTAEWDMPHDRINVFDLQMRFVRFLPLTYPAELGAGFHLSRIQGAKVYRNNLYATRDDDAKSLYRVNLETGAVSKVLSLNPGVPSELEGLAVRPTPDGALLHLLLIVHNKIDTTGDAAKIEVHFLHLAPGTRPCGPPGTADPAAGSTALEALL